jgi:hypothetical protein
VSARKVKPYALLRWLDRQRAAHVWGFTDVDTGKITNAGALKDIEMIDELRRFVRLAMARKPMKAHKREARK